MIEIPQPIKSIFEKVVTFKTETPEEAIARLRQKEPYKHVHDKHVKLKVVYEPIRQKNLRLEEAMKEAVRTHVHCPIEEWEQRREESWAAQQRWINFGKTNYPAWSNLSIFEDHCVGTMVTINQKLQANFFGHHKIEHLLLEIPPKSGSLTSGKSYPQLLENTHF